MWHVHSGIRGETSGAQDDKEWGSDLRGAAANCRVLGRGWVVPNNLIKADDRIRAAAGCMKSSAGSG